MEQTKNEPKNENKAAPGNGKPKKERKPLTEAQRLKRQKMIVLPAMVLVFIGAMWLIFAPSSGKEQEPGTGGYNIEMPDADKENRRIIGDKAKAYEQGAMEERQENRSRAMQQLGDLFDRETAAADRDSDFDLANPGGTEEAEKPAPKTIQSSAAAYRDLNATLGNFYEQPKNDNAEMDELLERIATLESELESGKERSSTMDEQVALMEKPYELAALAHYWQLIRRESTAQLPGREHTLALLAQAVFTLLLRNARLDDHAASGMRGELKLFQRFNQMIDSHYHQHWTVPDYARELHLTESRLTDICRRFANRSPKRLIFDRQLREAKRLLLFSDSAVNEIAWQLGFKDPAYFARFFSRQVGCSPSSYRAQKVTVS